MSTNAYVSNCTECGEHTCLNNVSTRPVYHDWECWSCGMYYESRTDEYGQMLEDERIKLKLDMEVSQ